MPIFDYECRGCGHHFEALVIPQVPSPACPKCQSQELEQLISSTFAVNSQERSKSRFKEAKTQTEKSLREERVARQEEWNDHH